MASFSGLTFSLCIFLLLLNPPFSSANLQFKASQNPSLYHSLAGAGHAPPTTFFEVTKPITLPKDKTCSYLALTHSFANTYFKPPVLASYNPPFKCNVRGSTKIVLEWTATSKGQQYGRPFGVWVDGVEIFRSSAPRVLKNGAIWSVKKDITRYHSLLTAEKEQTLAVYLPNYVDITYTGVFNATLSFHFVHSEENSADADNKADLILPISRNLPLNDGLWFNIQSSSDVALKELNIPQNSYKAVLELYISFVLDDQLWFWNIPNDYTSINNQSDSGNGPFREVVVKLDDLVVGAVWPFTYILNGDINPFLWRPITGIGSFDLPTYDIELTPFLGLLLDGKNHTFAFSVTNALSYWCVGANLHLWLDKKMRKTQGKLLIQRNSPLFFSEFLNISGLDGVFTTDASRTLFSIGWVRSSHGVINTTSRQELMYHNVMRIWRQFMSQTVDQTIESNSSIDLTKSSSKVGSAMLFSQFHFLVHIDNMDRKNGNLYLTNVSLGFNKKSGGNSDLGSFTGTLENRQDAHGYVVYRNDTLDILVGGSGTTWQDFRYSVGKSCYGRNVSSSNGTILHDVERNLCWIPPV